MSTLTLPERQPVAQVTDEDERFRRVLEPAIRAAIDWRETLGTLDGPASIEGPWQLAERLEDSVTVHVVSLEAINRVSARAGIGTAYGLIFYKDRIGEKDEIWVGLQDESEMAYVLAHELGHHLLTCPSRAGISPYTHVQLLPASQEYQDAEDTANTFAFVMLRDFTEFNATP